MKKSQKILLAFIFIIGLGIFSYPILSNIYNNNFQTRAIDEYNNVVKYRPPEEIEKMKKKMDAYNKQLATGQPSFEEPFGAVTEQADNIDNAGIVLDSMEEEHGAMIGVLEIPSIHTTSPIFSGVSDFQLQRGVGVLPGTSLPVGGTSTHSVITGHRGLPTAKLFTDLPKMQLGDTFSIEVLDEELVYKVNDIQTIEPDDVLALKIIEGKDLVTLLTCTPYMINTHRLIVTGYRINPTENERGVKMYNTIIGPELPTWMGWIQENCCWLILLLILIFGLLHTILLIKIYRRVKAFRCHYPQSHDKDKNGKRPPRRTRENPKSRELPKEVATDAEKTEPAEEVTPS